MKRIIQTHQIAITIIKRKQIKKSKIIQVIRIDHLVLQVATTKNKHIPTIQAQTMTIAIIMKII